jgi:hypothetical protein
MTQITVPLPIMSRLSYSSYICSISLRHNSTLVDQDLLIIEASRSDSDTPQSVGFLWTSTQPDGETSTWQKIHHSQETDFQAHGGIRTRNPKKGAAAEPRLWPRGHRSWLFVSLVQWIIVLHGISASALSHLLLKHCCLYVNVFEQEVRKTPNSSLRWGHLAPLNLSPLSPFPNQRYKTSHTIAPFSCTAECITFPPH